MNDFKLTPQLKLLFWLINHTKINNDKKPISNKELARIFYKNNPGIEFKNINLSIGYNLSLIYGQDLIKYNIAGGGIAYNIATLKNPVKEIFIKDYGNVYTLDYLNRNKKEFTNSHETYLTLCKLFKDNNYLKPSQLYKINGLCNELILFCLNKGIPKRYLKYFLFYLMSFINKQHIGQLHMIQKKQFKKNKVCAVCGASENLTIHHIKPISKAPYLKYNTNNFIVLCRECHIKHHHQQDLLMGGGK